MVFAMFLFCLAVALPVRAQTSGSMSYRRLSPGEAAQHLAAFRKFRLAGDVCFQFTLTHVPRKDEAGEVYRGTLWGSSSDQGPVFRIELAPAAGGATGAPQRFLLQGGPKPELWIVGNEGKPVRVASDLTRPFSRGLILTPFEVQTPFVYWPDAAYLEPRRVRGRPAHVFQMNPPEEFKKTHPGTGFVRLAFDRQFNYAITQAVVYDAKGDELRKFEVEHISKVQETYIPTEFRVLDLVSRDKDIFRVTHAALHLKLPRSTFDPAMLAQSVALPDAKDFATID
jgi:hypothetical protein